MVLAIPEIAPRYMLIIDRINNLDTLTVQVEVRPDYFTSDFDTPGAVENLRKKVEMKLRSVLSIGAKVEIKAPGSIERSQGKSVRVLDKRKLK